MLYYKSFRHTLDASAEELEDLRDLLAEFKDLADSIAPND